MKALVLILLLTFAVSAQRPRKQRRAKPRPVQVVKPLHPCETAQHRETGGRFNQNCSHAESEHPSMDWPPK